MTNARSLRRVGVASLLAILYAAFGAGCADIPPSTPAEALSEIASEIRIRGDMTGAAKQKSDPRDRLRRSELDRAKYQRRFEVSAPAGTTDDDLPMQADEEFERVRAQVGRLYETPDWPPAAFSPHTQGIKRGPLLISLLLIMSQFTRGSSLDAATINFGVVRSWLETEIASGRFAYAKACVPVTKGDQSVGSFRRGGNKYACELRVPPELHAGTSRMALLFSQKSKGWNSPSAEADVRAETRLLAKISKTAGDYVKVVPTDTEVFAAPCVTGAGVQGATECTGYLQQWMGNIDGSTYEYWHFFGHTRHSVGKELDEALQVDPASRRLAIYGRPLTSEGRARLATAIDNLILLNQSGRFIHDVQGFLSVEGPDQGEIYITDPLGFGETARFPKHLVDQSADELRVLKRIAGILQDGDRRRGGGFR